MPPKKKTATKAKAKPTKAALEASSGKKTATATHKESGISFDKLPAEIRNRIYHMALTFGWFQQIPNRKVPMDDSHGIVFHEPALLAASRQIRQEASLIFYANNTFEAVSSAYAAKFVRQIGPEKTTLLKNLRACKTRSAPGMSRVRVLNALASHLRNLSDAAEGSLDVGEVYISLTGDLLNRGEQWTKLIDATNLDVTSEDGQWSVEVSGDVVDDYWW